MVDRSVFIGWGAVVRGRERRALEVFGEGMAYYADAEREGRIAKMDVVLLGPSGSDLGGFWILRGDREQIAALHEDDRWQRMMIEASLIVDDLCVIDGYVGDGISDQMTKYAESLSTVLAAA